MTARAIARQYAHALFDVARKSRQTDRIGRDVAEFASLVASHSELSAVLASPAVPALRKRAVVDALVLEWPELSPEARRLFQLLADRDRLMHLSAIAAVYEERTMELNRVARGELTTTTPLDAETRRQVVAALGQAVARDVTVTEHVDPSLVGGFTARVGSVVFDGSVRRHLERLRERLLADVS